MIYTSNGFYIYHHQQKKIVSLSREKDNYYRELNAVIKNHPYYIFKINKNDQIFILNFKSGIDSIYVLDLRHKKTVSSQLTFSVSNIDWWSRIDFQFDSLFAITVNGGIHFFRFNSATMQASSLNKLP